MGKELKSLEVQGSREEPQSISTLENLFNLGFTIIGDSRDFSNGSIEVVLGRGHERLTWVFPMKSAKIGITTPEGNSAYIQAPIDHLSFDVVVPPRK